jgi:serine/threonine-protein kinase
MLQPRAFVKKIADRLKVRPLSYLSMNNFATVLKVVKLETGKPDSENPPIALKVRHLSTSRLHSPIESLRREALALVSCRHAYVVQLYDFHSDADVCALMMQFATGGSLARDELNHGERMPWKKLQQLLSESLDALDFLHATGCIHNNIAPENLLIDHEGKIKLCGFGHLIMPADDKQESIRKEITITNRFMSPERMARYSVDSRSDIFSLGVSFYELFTGRNPNRLLFDKTGSPREFHLAPSVHELRPEVPVKISNCIKRMMQYRPVKRYQTASEALNDMASA